MKYLILFLMAQTTPTTFPNLPVVCTEQKDLTNQPINACKSDAQKFLRATATSWVRYCLSSKGCPVTSTDPITNPPAVWKRFDQIADTDFVEVCTVARTPGDPVAGGSCPATGGSTWSGMKYVGKPSVNVLPPPPMNASFTVTPESGNSPLDVTVAWNVPGLTGTTPCIAEGYPGWAGAKVSSSQEQFTLIENAAFTLTCADIDTRNVLLNWSPPTQNQDGTVLTDLASYTIHYGNSYIDLKPVLSHTIPVKAPASYYIIEGLTPGTWMFGMKAQNSSGAQSDLSQVVTYTTRVSSTPPVPRFTATKYVTVTTVPNPPDDLTVVEPKAFSLTQTPDKLTVQEFGYVAVGTQCDPEQAAMGLFLVKRDTTVPNKGQTTPPVALAKCEYDKKAKTTTWKSEPLP